MASALVVAGLGLAGCASATEVARESAVTVVHAKEAGLRRDVNLAALNPHGPPELAAVQAVLPSSAFAASQGEGIVVIGVLSGHGEAQVGLTYEGVTVRVCFTYTIPDGTGRIVAEDAPCDPTLATQVPSGDIVGLEE